MTGHRTRPDAFRYLAMTLDSKIVNTGATGALNTGI